MSELEPPARNILPGAIYDAWRLSELSAAQFAQLAPSAGAEVAQGSAAGLNAAQLRYVAGFALLAPTSHNTVPQRFRLDVPSSTLEVWLDRNDVLPESDAHGRQALVSVGCALAHIECVAESLGLELELSAEPVPGSAVRPLALAPELPAQALLARVRLTRRPEAGAAARSEPSATPWLRLMLEHKVVRAEYDRSVPLPAELRAALVQAVSEVHPGLQLHVLEQSLVLRSLGKFQEQADRYVFENRRFAEELGRWLLPNDERASGRAMRGHEFGFDAEFATKVHHGLLGTGPLLPDQVAAFARGGRAGLESSSAVLVISTAGDSTELRLAAGRAGQRLALMLHQQQFCNAFHAALTEVEWVSKMFAATVLCTTRRPMLLMRVGKVKRAADARRPHASRPSLDQILIA